MQTEQMTVSPKEARALYRAYKEHLHYSSPLDREIMRCYQLIAQGRLVIRAIESIVKAGVKDCDGFPKLGIVRADASRCYLRFNDNGSARMSSTEWADNRSHRQYIDFPRGSFPVKERGGWRAQSIVPPCPLQYRPRRGLANYHILFEAEWTRRIPIDPLLLRRIGKADLWAVLAAWDVTEVERAVLQSRIAN